MYSNCNITFYSKTERHLNVRASEHIGVSHLTGKGVECKSFAISDQFLLDNHYSNFNPIQDGLFGGCSQIGGGEAPHP